MGHEYYGGPPPETGDRPPDELARRLFATGSIDGMHINSNVITVDLAKGASTAGLREIVEDLFIHYRPGVAVPAIEGAAGDG